MRLALQTSCEAASGGQSPVYISPQNSTTASLDSEKEGKKKTTLLVCAYSSIQKHLHARAFTLTARTGSTIAAKTCFADGFGVSAAKRAFYKWMWVDCQQHE